MKYYTVQWVIDCTHDSDYVHTEKDDCRIFTSAVAGAAPSFGGTPSKTADAKATYVFSGWATEPNAQKPGKLAAVEGDVTYYALFREEKRQYTVTWVLTRADGCAVTVREAYLYGKMPIYEGTVFAPTDMEFIGWDKEIATVSGDVTYTAVYAKAYGLGDVNGDGIVNTRDLAMLRQYVVGKISLTEAQMERANVYEDYNGDGTAKINTRDVAVLQQYILGIVEAPRT